MTKRRARNLDDQAIERIIRILDGWSGKLSWDLLVDSIERYLGVRYTRQALDKHGRIKSAYQIAKERISNISSSGRRQRLAGAETGVLIQRLERLEAENARLRVENERLLEQFMTWAYNAHLKGLSKEYLNAPLPSVDRELTKAK